MKIHAYLFFDGRCEEAFKFYETCFRGKIEMMMPHAGSPAEKDTPKEWHWKILHAALMVGDQMLMASDAPPQYHQKMSGFAVSLAITDPAEAERVFNELADGGKVNMPFGETFWAHRFGMVEDRFGTPWMISCEKPAT
jgi:PhnB protein